MYYGSFNVLIFMGTKLSNEQCPTTSLEMEDMAYFPPTNVVGNLVYALVYILDQTLPKQWVSSVDLWLILDVNIV